LDRFREYLPENIPLEDDVLELRCEAVMRKSVFEAKYAAEFANARNIVAGIIGKTISTQRKLPILLLFPYILLRMAYIEKLKRQKRLQMAIYFFPIAFWKMRPIIKDYLWV